jgi:glycosyltransferase involved in cell wall biosynthesis
MKTISACIICKNEEPVLDKMFNSIKSVVDEIIFVDTGSTDKSKDIAAKYGAKIYDFPWTGSFSDARNEAMKYATKDFIFQIDCDETLTSQSVAELQRLKNCDLKLYNVTMHNFLDTGDMVVSNNFRL